ncbi:hypothetical protein D3C83_190940 [compost metagenome]
MTGGEPAFVLIMEVFIHRNISPILILRTMIGKKAVAWAIVTVITGKKMHGIIILPNH